jgi:hypothetical protein
MRYVSLLLTSVISLHSKSILVQRLARVHSIRYGRIMGWVNKWKTSDLTLDEGQWIVLDVNFRDLGMSSNDDFTWEVMSEELRLPKASHRTCTLKSSL